MKARLFVGTFRHPYGYTLILDTADKNDALRCDAIWKATGGHSWMHIHKTQHPHIDMMYCTGWTDPPSLTAYRLVGDSFSDDFRNGDSISPIVQNEAHPRYLSGYVTANERALYSVSGPQGDVFAIEPSEGYFITDGREREGKAVPLQSFSFVSEEERAALDRGENIGGIMDFGGLRHGGHVRSFPLCHHVFFPFAVDSPSERGSLPRWKQTLRRRHVRNPLIGETPRIG